MIGFEPKAKQAAAWLTIATMILANSSAALMAQAARGASDATEIAQPLAEDRGSVALSQSLKRLGTWASLMMIVAHPDDEDGAMLTYESRGQGVRTSLLTLTRGEGGQNAMSADSYDALGVIRTNELLRAGQFYGVKQYWGTEADFGFSKTQEESFQRWGHDRVLFDAVLAVRRERPMILVSSFVGGITDGHGQHQVSGEISQEAFVAAGDPKVFPEQIAAGLKPWSPLKVYARVPFAPVTDKGMFDYATGKWAPVRFYNYVTKEWSTTAPTADVSIPEGRFDPVLGRSYGQIAREGWGEEKSQNGGANPTLSGGDGTEFHLYGSRVTGPKAGVAQDVTFFGSIPTNISGLESLLSSPVPAWLHSGLSDVAGLVRKAQTGYVPYDPGGIALVLKAGYLATRTLRDRVTASDLKESEKANVAAELDIKLAQFQTAMTQSLGLDLQAFTVRGGTGQQGPFGGGFDETPRSVTPGQAIQVKIHTNDASGKVGLSRVWLEGADGKRWAKEVEKPGSDEVVKATVPADAEPTEPYFSRPNMEQPYYDTTRPELRGYSFAPYPVAAWAEFNFDGLPIRMGEVVQSMDREPGRGGIFRPLVIAPLVGVRVEPDARILPLNGDPLPVKVTIHTEGAAEGKVRLTLPAGWTASPAEAEFHRTQAGDAEPLIFKVKAVEGKGKTDSEFKLTAVAESNDKMYTSGWQTVGYPGLRPYNLYRKAELKTRAFDVKLATSPSGGALRVGYVMGTGDTVPEAIEGLGLMPHLLSASELASGDLSAWDVILIGIRAYSMRPELAAAQARLNAFVAGGGTLIVQYQSANFPAPFPLTLGRIPERVVEEAAPVAIVAKDSTLLNFPNKITERDFDGWVEERGHSFMDSWDPAYTALTETADAGQDPQKGGLLVAHAGKGTYIYDAFALHRQLPELVPGAYRLLANLLSAR